MLSVASSSSHRLFQLPGVPQLLRRRRVQAGVSADATLQPDQVPLGEEPRGEVRLRCHLRQGLSQASSQR